jgi:hypothetical protein
MVIALVLLIALIVFDLASWRWGVDSTEGIYSREWDKRRNWGAI